MTARFLGSALIAVAVTATVVSAVVRIKNPSRAMRLVERFPALNAVETDRGRSTSFVPDPMMRHQDDITEESQYDGVLKTLLSAETAVLSREEALNLSKARLTQREREVHRAALRLDRLLKGWPWWVSDRKIDRAVAVLREAQRRRDAARTDAAAAEYAVVVAQNDVRDLLTPVRAAREARHRRAPIPRDPAHRGTLVERATIVVTFDDHAPIDEIAGLLERLGLTVRSGIPRLSFFVVEALREDWRPPELWEADAMRIRAIVERLRKENIVYSAVQNSLLGEHIVPRPTCKPRQRINCTASYNWFNATNLPLINSHFPQAWNFMQAIQLSGGKRPVVGILDVGFNKACKEEMNPTTCDLILPFASARDCGTDKVMHGTQMASIIGSEFGDGHGIDGATPFANLYKCAPIIAIVSTTANSEEEMEIVRNKAPFDAFIKALEALHKLKPAVINASVGYVWTIDPAKPEYTDIQRLVADQAKDVRKLLDQSETILVASAGNDSCDAKWASPFNFAALGPADAQYNPSLNIIVVEGLNVNGIDLLSNTNTGGSIRAIGEDVHTQIGLDANDEPAYVRAYPGTSSAAALVTATIAMIRTRAATISVADIRDSLGIPASPPPTLNAFKALQKSTKLSNTELADLTGEGRVDRSDFDEFKSAFRQVNGVKGTKLIDDLNKDGNRDANDIHFCRADLDGDDTLTKMDLQVLCAGWTTGSVDCNALEAELTK